MATKRRSSGRKKAGREGGEPGTQSPPREEGGKGGGGHPKRRERTYTDADKLDAIHAVVFAGSARQAGLKLGIPHETISSWLRDPKWTTEVARIRTALMRAIEEQRASEIHELLALGRDARLLTQFMLEQEARAAKGERVPKEQRVRPGVALGALREATNAHVALDRASKTVSESPSNEGITVHLSRGTGVRRRPVAVED